MLENNNKNEIKTKANRVYCLQVSVIECRKRERELETKQT